MSYADAIDSITHYVQTHAQMVDRLGAAYARVWAIVTCANGATGKNPALAEVAAVALVDIHAVKLALAALRAPEVPALARDETLCAVCGWPLDATGLFCRRGNCSLRPFPDRCYDAARAVREYGDTTNVVSSARTTLWRAQADAER